MESGYKQCLDGKSTLLTRDILMRRLGDNVRKLKAARTTQRVELLRQDEFDLDAYEDAQKLEWVCVQQLEHDLELCSIYGIDKPFGNRCPMCENSMETYQEMRENSAQCTLCGARLLQSFETGD